MGPAKPIRGPPIVSQGQREETLGCLRASGFSRYGCIWGGVLQRVTTQCHRGGGKSCHVWDAGAALEHGMSRDFCQAISLTLAQQVFFLPNDLTTVRRGVDHSAGSHLVSLLLVASEPLFSLCYTTNTAAATGGGPGARETSQSSPEDPHLPKPHHFLAKNRPWEI